MGLKPQTKRYLGIGVLAGAAAGLVASVVSHVLRLF